MLGILGMDLPGQAFDLSFRRPPLAERSGQPMLVGMGDPVGGPLVGLFYDAPSTPEQLAGPPDLTPAHSHSCDNFRICMKGELWVGQERYHHGEFRFQQSGRPYGSDGDAPHVEGNWRLIFFADRRGHAVRPTNRGLRAQTSAMTREIQQRYGEILPVILDDEDDGVIGLVMTLRRPLSRVGHLDGTFADAAAWPDFTGGSKIVASLMGLHDVGPAVVLLRTAAGGLATPACTLGSDAFRLVIGGSCTWDGEERVMGDARFQAAGVPWEAIVAGPEGLDQVVIIGDRRGAAFGVGDDPAARAWAGEMASVLAALDAELHASVA